ncbi:MAG: response regulator [Anaerolineales bacterium]
MKKILVIDDTRQTADALVNILKVLGFDARAAYGASAGMAILNANVPDAIFVDINMPGVTGFDILMYISRDPRLENVPVIVITSDDQPETRTRALSLGAKDVIIKPVAVERIEPLLWQLRLL